MRKQYKLMCMSPDGDNVIENLKFDTIKDAWEYESNLGSKWYFYPFHFIVTESAKTIVDAINVLGWSVGKRVYTVKKAFSEASKKPENQNLDIELYMFVV